jgi:SSS family solute:Na+ symporter
VVLTIVAYAIAVQAPQTIFDIAVQYAFSGYSALCPLLIAALFWKRSTKWGALACTIWTVAAVLAVAFYQYLIPAPAPGPPIAHWSPGGFDVLARTAGGTAVFGFMPVVPMTIVSALLMIVVSLLTAKPRQESIDRYFKGRL